MRKKYDLYGEEGLKEDFQKSWKGNYHSWNYYHENFGNLKPFFMYLNPALYTHAYMNMNQLKFFPYIK